MNEYTEFIRMHKVDARAMTRGDYNRYRCWELPANENPNDEGYLVKYPDGYISWCPKAQFEAAARRIDGMTFGMAIEAMKRGAKVARSIWGDKGIFFIWMKHAYLITLETNGTPRLMDVAEHDIAEKTGGEVKVAPVICICDEHQTEQPGWIASQMDIFAEDWMIVTADNATAGVDHEPEFQQ